MKIEILKSVTKKQAYRFQTQPTASSVRSADPNLEFSASMDRVDAVQLAGSDQSIVLNCSDPEDPEIVTMDHLIEPRIVLFPRNPPKRGAQDDELAIVDPLEEQI